MTSLMEFCILSKLNEDEIYEQGTKNNSSKR